MDFPQDFSCPISMELMKDPVSLSTGITYDRKNIETWFHIYHKRTCPTTMQPLETLEATPNLTLKRLIDAWLNQNNPSLHETHQWNHLVAHDNLNPGVDFFKSILESVSNNIYTVQLLLQILEGSKKSRLKAIEAGAMSLLIELLPESSRSRSEKVLVMIKLMCECADGRLAFTEHGLGIAAVSEKMSVSSGATRTGVKIMWLITRFQPKERVLEEMMLCGAVERMVSLIQVDGGGSLKERVVGILKMHGGVWRRYPCFPTELKS